MKFPRGDQKMLFERKWHLNVMELVIKKSATPSFVSMWPSNVELPLMATEVSKRKHILEFPLFKRTENQTKLKLSKENIG